MSLNRSYDKWLAWQRRSQPLKRTRMPRGSKPLQSRTARGEAKRKRQMGDDGPDRGLGDFCRSRPCDACGQPGPSDPAHILTRGAGHGTLTRDGRPNLVSLCRVDHTRQESQGWAAIGLTEDEAFRIAARVRAQWASGQEASQ